MKKHLLNFRFMKKAIPVVAIATLMVACNSTPKTENTDAMVQTEAVSISAEDSMVLSQFHAWKAENELKDARAFLGEGTEASGNEAKTASSTRSTSRKSSGTSTTRKSTPSTNTGTVYNSESANAAKKKGWSKAAKGAVIGGVAGGVAGAVINKKNRVAGGIIGAVVGAGGGYVIGRGMDKKDGRIQYQK